MSIKFVSEGDLKLKKMKQAADLLGAITVAPVNEPVIVQSKKVNDSAITIRFNKFIKKGPIKEERYLSRTYTFKNFEAKIPFKLAKQLVSENMNDFTILGPLDENLDALKEKINTFNAEIDKKKAHKKRKWICDVCGQEFVNQLLLGKHKKNAHAKSTGENSEQATA